MKPPSNLSGEWRVASGEVPLDAKRGGWQQGALWGARFFAREGPIGLQGGCGSKAMQTKGAARDGVGDGAAGGRSPAGRRREGDGWWCPEAYGKRTGSVREAYGKGAVGVGKGA